jgi:hypothetical protein
VLIALFGGAQSEPDTIGLVLFKLKDSRLPAADKTKIESWLQIRLQSENIRVFFEPPGSGR